MVLAGAAATMAVLAGAAATMAVLVNTGTMAVSVDTGMVAASVNAGTTAVLALIAVESDAGLIFRFFDFESKVVVAGTGFGAAGMGFGAATVS